jgi:Domain of unknown function (DUF4360)
MKPTIKIIIASLLFSTLSQAIEITDVQIAGSGCSVPVGSQDLIPIVGSVDRFGIPLMMNIEKQSAPSLVRKSCLFSMSVKLQAGQKLQILDVSQKVKLLAGAGAKASTQLEVFLAGQSGVPLKAEIGPANKLQRSSQVLNSVGVVAESACGKDVIVRANSSVMLQGPSRAKVSAEALALSMKIVACQ